MLSNAADKTLMKNIDEITKSLLDGTLKGNASSACLLVKLADRQPETGKNKKKHLASQAEELRGEPEWAGGTAEAAVERG